MTYNELTKLQQAVLWFVMQYTHEYRYPPSTSDIGEYLNISREGALYHLRNLKAAGFVNWESRQLSRTLHVTYKSDIERAGVQVVIGGVDADWWFSLVKRDAVLHHEAGFMCHADAFDAAIAWRFEPHEIELSNIRLMILRFIQTYSEQYDKSPTYQEIADHVGRGVTTIRWYLDQLLETGAVKWQPGVNRSLQVTGG